MLTGCRDYEADALIGAPVQVELAYTFSSSAAGSQTRQPDDVVVPNTSTPRLPQYLTVIQMKGSEPQNSYVTWNNPVAKPDDPARTSSLYYHSSFCDMKQGVNGCLVYGGVDDASTPYDKTNKGSLEIPSFASVNTQSDLQNLTFCLEPIYKSSDYTATEGIPDDASTLAGYLNTVAAASGWKASTNPILKNLFENFTSHGSDLPGSSASVEKWIEAVKKAAEDYLDPDKKPSSIGTTEEDILQAIIVAADGITISGSYPRGLYLPDGAAALRWNGSVFVPAMQTTTLDNINSVSRFAYPASLYYFVDSKIRTSNSPVNYVTEYNGVTSEVTKTGWDDILDRNFTDGTLVNASTKSVALEDPVQYAVAQLKVTVKAESTTLKDNAGTDITIDETTFPLTGVIVCGQRPVNYLFEQGSNSDVDVKFIYDSQVKKSDNTYYFMTASDPSGGPSTLVLQSFEGEDVDIILEFENAGNQTFQCIDGFVYPNTRFYLIGKIAAPTKVDNDEKTYQVFTKDYITTVNMTVRSLAKAYNVLPNLLTSNLEIGVETTPKWVAATPTVIELE